MTNQNDKIEILLDKDIQFFIKSHENTDTSALALKKSPNPNWPYKDILEQIKARQKAQIKAPALLDHENIILPAPGTIEQASSWPTALYKASLVKGESFIDLTGGFGIDSFAIRRNFQSGLIIDQDPFTAACLTQNIKAMNIKGLKSQYTTAEDWLKTAKPYDLIIIDPARRSDTQKGRYRLEDCTPNILKILPELLRIAPQILLKTSPLLDITQAIKQLQSVSSVHIIEYEGECKELLFLITTQKNKNPPITAVNINKTGKPEHTLTFTLEDEKAQEAGISPPLQYLYEPSPAFQKSGAFKTLAKITQTAQLHPHTNLYTSDNLADFPGRAFKIINIYPAKKENIPIKKAHLKCRNFPISTENLRKKLKIKDGGNDYLFACTLNDGKHSIIHTKKMDKTKL